MASRTLLGRMPVHSRGTSSSRQTMSLSLAAGARKQQHNHRSLATHAPHPVNTAGSAQHKVLVVGGGAAGLAVSHQLLRSGKFAPNEIAIVDPAQTHDYQPGWTLVGAGLKTKEELRRPLRSLIDNRLQFYNDGVATFTPQDNIVTLRNGTEVGYDQLVVVPGIEIKYNKINGLSEALADPNIMVSSVYGFDTCDKVNRTTQAFRKGQAIFTQPSGMVKCAGAPQKAMWLAVDKWTREGVYRPNDATSSSPIKVTFATALPVMFGVPKYSQELNKLRQQRGVEGLFEHDLVSIDSANKATFARPDGSKVTRSFDSMHVVPKMGPFDFVAQSLLANPGNGLVDIDEKTMRHKKFGNVWSIGDASNLPTSKTAAAITAQAPVLVDNMMAVMAGQEPTTVYNGYTSCPILTEYGKVMLAEFKYGGEPFETFGRTLGLDQSVPRRAFYYLKKDFFPWVYYKAMVKGTWAGPKGFIR
ncbi:hypothetical protein SBRCBS47491_010019 [Sporothrix bragantina]|uniref:FAD/NAD(P)-binding domain-containing protein n=1 Tax=Sporothrix bragantina TaxID=671064 RepID=A0ABP0D0K3_9PEZI